MVKASIVILTQGKAPRVVECLEKQTYQNFEVIFAREPGIVQAMNAALTCASGEVFIRVDDDVEIPPDWLREILKPFDNLKVGGVTGPTFVPYSRRQNRDSIRIWQRPGWLLRWLQDGRTFAPAAIYKCGMVSYDSNYSERFEPIYNGVQKPYAECDHLEGTNWAMRTALVRQVGGFDPAFDGVAEWFDTDVEQKVKKLGYRLVYNPKAWLYHLLEYTEHYQDRFEGWGRIKNWLRYHQRHSRFHPKMLAYLAIWGAYFLGAGRSR